MDLTHLTASLDVAMLRSKHFCMDKVCAEGLQA